MRVLATLILLAATPASAAPFAADAPKACDACEGWNAPQAPYRIFGNTYYVGTEGLSAILVAGEDGLALIDAGLPQSAPSIDASIRALGFDTARLRLILNSHAHYDHAGGIAALQRASGAVVAASGPSAAALRAGQLAPDDPQYDLPDTGFPPVREVRTLRDGETVAVGAVRLTAHFTPGHTPGGTSWSWQSCEGERCLDIVYADSLTAVSAPSFRFTAAREAPSLAVRFGQSIDSVRDLRCDILLTPHPEFAQLHAKRLRRDAGDRDAFVSRAGCQAYAAAARAGLEKRLARERAPRP